jgi:hypothetical protein
MRKIVKEELRYAPLHRWEDGLAIVQLGNVRFSTIWEEERKTTLLQEISESFDRWTLRGGRVDHERGHPLVAAAADDGDARRHAVSPAGRWRCARSG